MRIINIFSGFQNAYNDAGWQLWYRSNLIGVYHTRKDARNVAATCLPTRANIIALLENSVYDTSTVRISRTGEVSAIMDANKTRIKGPHTVRHYLGQPHQFNFPGRQSARESIANAEGRS